MKIFNYLFFLFCLSWLPVLAQQKTIWKIGENDNAASGMALAPDQVQTFRGK